MTQPNGITINCSAKINLFLHVTDKRADGYHDLQSWVAFAEVGDTVRVREAKQFHISVDGPFAHLLPPMGDNLITKTVNLLSERHQQKPNVMIELTKNLPIGTGMGGGSANAAATARGLQHLWGFDWVPDDAVWLARNLGADVPVCLLGQSVMMGGIGEDLQKTTTLPPDCHIVIVHPAVGVSTSAVFNMMSPPYTPPIESASEIRDVLDLVQALQQTRNDLMHPAIAIEPKILEVYRALTRQSGCLLARMTGSGSACFGIFADEETARAASFAIRHQEPKWWVRATRLQAN
jgi:4-diphosphocytidyl-2-C-methyl-D-erythritol kinase